LDGI
jgi:transformation/transcription domain-associated protein